MGQPQWWPTCVCMLTPEAVATSVWVHSWSFEVIVTSTKLISSSNGNKVWSYRQPMVKMHLKGKTRCRRIDVGNLQFTRMCRSPDGVRSEGWLVGNRVGLITTPASLCPRQLTSVSRRHRKPPDRMVPRDCVVAALVTGYGVCRSDETSPDWSNS